VLTRAEEYIFQQKIQEEFEEDILYKLSICNLARRSVLTCKLLQKKKKNQSKTNY